MAGYFQGFLRRLVASISNGGAAVPLDAGGSVWRRFGVRPLARRLPQAAHPVHVATAVPTGEEELLESSFEFGLGLQELEPQHLRRDRHGVIRRQSAHRLVDDQARIRGLSGDRGDGSFEDLAVRRRHGPMLRGGPDSASRRHLGGPQGQGPAWLLNRYGAPDRRRRPTTSQEVAGRALDGCAEGVLTPRKRRPSVAVLLPARPSEGGRDEMGATCGGGIAGMYRPLCLLQRRVGRSAGSGLRTIELAHP